MAGFAIVAALALGNGLDRASAGHPALARWVPSLLKAEAWRADAATLLQAGNYAAASTAATNAVLADPIDPRSAALLGAAQLAAGQRIIADRSFRVAARFGWRDPLTQIYFMNAALDAQQPRLAALRLDAVLRQAPNLPVRNMLIAQFTGRADRRAALTDRLALRPAWTDAFSKQVGQLDLAELEARSGMIETLARPAWGCDAVASLAARLIAVDGVAQAKRLWMAHCPGASTGIADPHFAALVQHRAAIPFEWTLPNSGDVNAVAADGNGLIVRVSGPSPHPVAWQMLSLAPGRYRLSWIAQTTAAGAASGLEMSLSCRPDGRSRILGTPAQGVPGRFDAAVELDSACLGHYLTIWLAPGPEDIRIDSLAISPL